MKIFKAIISIVFISVLSGCGGSNVDIVKNGFLKSILQTTHINQ